MVEQSRVGEKSRKQEVNRLVNGIIIDSLTTIDILETAQIGGTVFEIHEGMLKKESFNRPYFKKFDWTKFFRKNYMKKMVL